MYVCIRIFLVNSMSALVMFDSGVTHSFVSRAFIPQLRREAKPLPCPLAVEVADNRIVIVNDIIRGCTLKISEVDFPIDLIPIAMRELCVIVGMDWMEQFDAKIACRTKRVSVRTPGGEKLVVQGDTWRRSTMFCSNRQS